MASITDVVPKQVQPLTVASWSRVPWLVHGFTTRPGGVTLCYGGSDGELNLGFTAGDEAARIVENRERVLVSIRGTEGLGSWALVTLRQTHSALIHRADAGDGLALDHGPLREGDGLVTDVPGLLLGILTADCVPVLVVDPQRRSVGAFHAGWKGTVQAIVEQGIERMTQEFGSEPAELLAAVGPAIGACCYMVGEEVHRQFTQRFSYAAELFSPGPAEGLRLDLAEANRRQLLSAGLRDQSITLMGACTGCDTARFFSHRAEHGVTGRMMAVVGIRAESAEATGLSAMQQ